MVPLNYIALFTHSKTKKYYFFFLDKRICNKRVLIIPSNYIKAMRTKIQKERESFKVSFPTFSVSILK